MKYTDLTQEQIRNIVADYTENKISIPELLEKHNITKGMLYSVKKRHHLKSRHSVTTKTRTCKECEKEIKDKEAKFCPYCGRILLTPQERALEELDYLSSAFELIKSSSNRNRCINAILRVKQYIITGDVDD